MGLQEKIAEKIILFVWDKHFSKILAPIFYDENKINWRNIKIFFMLIVLGFFFYFFPSILVPILIHWDWQNTNVYFSHLTSDIHYFHAIQYILALSYWVFVLVIFLFLMARTIVKSNAQVESIVNENKAAKFARAVNLVGGSRFSTEIEKKEMLELITKKFDESSTIKVMMINWFEDLITPSSPILHALTKNCQKDIKVLLLDPFSSFARQRSEHLAGAGDDNSNWLRYIYMFKKVRDKLDHINQDHDAKISHSIFCSRPFFRFYLFDQDLFIQVYHDKYHGRSSPMFHYQKSESGSILDDSFFQLGVELFDYYLKNSFQFDDAKLKAKGSAFTVYLARMYNILNDSNVNKLDDLRSKILTFVQRKTSEATSSSA